MERSLVEGTVTCSSALRTLTSSRVSASFGLKTGCTLDAIGSWSTFVHCESSRSDIVGLNLDSISQSGVLYLYAHKLADRSPPSGRQRERNPALRSGWENRQMEASAPELPATSH